MLSVLLSLIRSWSIHYLFVFSLFFITSFLLSQSNVLSDIMIYRDSFNITNKNDLYFEPSFISFLGLVDQFDFTLVYATTVALSATLTFAVLTSFCSRQDFFSTFIFIALFANQFTIAWRQAMMMPGVTFCLCFFILYYSHKVHFKNLKVTGALISSSFHLAGLVSLMGALYRYTYFRYLAVILIFIFGTNFLIWSDFFMIISYRFTGSEAYIDYSTYSSSRGFLVVCKFLALALIAYFAWDTIKETTNAPKALAFLLLLKIIFAVAAVLIVSPAWGRMLGLLSLVDFVVLSKTLSRFKIISFGYLLVSFAASTLYNPFYQ